MTHWPGYFFLVFCYCGVILLLYIHINIATCQIKRKKEVLLLLFLFIYIFVSFCRFVSFYLYATTLVFCILNREPKKRFQTTSNDFFLLFAFRSSFVASTRHKNVYNIKNYKWRKNKKREQQNVFKLCGTRT